MSLVEKMIKRMAEAKARGSAETASIPDANDHPEESLPQTGATQRNLLLSAQRPQRQLDFAGLRASGLLAAEHERKLFSQIYRGIKRPILNRLTQRDLNARDQARNNVVMVTSAVPGDGKTFNAINLALSLALERERHVVLVDGDVVKRELSRKLGFLDEPGLMELLEDPTRLVDQYLIQTDLPNLSVLPAGKTSLHATELLSSPRMRSLVQQFAEGSEVLVIFDSPPLLLTTESRAIAEIAGQALLVVREGHTTKEMLDRALPLLQVCPSVSLILNQSLSHASTGYGYGYGYGNDEKAKYSSKQA